MNEKEQWRDTDGGYDWRSDFTYLIALLDEGDPAPVVYGSLEDHAYDLGWRHALVGRKSLSNEQLVEAYGCIEYAQTVSGRVSGCGRG